MGYRKCPRCNLNYIRDDEEYCPVCISETGYEKTVDSNGLELIHDFIRKVLIDFQQYLNESTDLCDLRSITFESNSLPEYGNVHVQQLYLLRYAYAYAYEYKLMYKELFKRYTVGPDITVTSVGCGNMIDYWALVQALADSDIKERTIHYTGVDVIDWQYKVNVRAGDFVGFERADAIGYFKNKSRLDSDIYFFPKSISEFSDEAFAGLCAVFKSVPVLKDKFCLLVSIRPVKVWEGTDVGRVTRLVNAIRSNGFFTEDDPCVYYSDGKPESNIFYLDPQFSYPVTIIDTLKNLTGQCATRDPERPNCKSCDRINRSPILTAKYVQYQLFTFYRGQK